MVVLYRHRVRAVFRPGCAFPARRPGKAALCDQPLPARGGTSLHRLDQHLAGREFIVGNEFTIADISAWGWIDRASFVLPGSDDPLAAYPNIRRWFRAIDARPAVARARAVGSSHTFKKEVDDETRRALFPSNYPPASA